MIEVAQRLRNEITVALIMLMYGVSFILFKNRR
jgi:hypothetical protein